MRGEGARFGFVYAALFLSLGVALPFLPVGLAERGLGAAEIGFIVAAPTVLRLFTTPLVADLADRSGRPVRVLQGAALVTLIGYGALATAEGFWPILLALVLAQAAAAAAFPLADSLTVRALAARPGAFGPVRLWGSASFIFGTLLGGALLPHLPGGAILWLIVACQALGVAVAVAAVRDGPVAPRAARRVAPLAHLATPAIVVPILAAALIQGSHGAYYGLGSVHWRALGLEGPAIGVIWSLGVAAEIALFLASARFSPAVTPALLMACGAAAAVVRWLAMATEPTGPLLIALQLLHALSYGATYLGTVRLLAAAAPAGASARVQGFAATAQGLVIALAVSLAGQLLPHHGGGMFLAMAGLAAAGGLVLVIGWRALAQPQRPGAGGNTVEPS